MKLSDIKERLTAVEVEMRGIYDAAETAGEDLTGEKLEKWTALDAERRDLQDKKERAETRDELDRKADGKDLEQRGGDEGVTAWLLPPEQRMSQYVARTTGGTEQRLSAGAAVRAMLTGDWREAEAEQRTMGGTTGAGGGFLLSTPMSANLIDLARKSAVMIQAGAGTIPMTTGSLKVAKVASDPTAQWRGEGDSITESDGSFEAVNLKAYSLAALCRVNNELLDDAAGFAATLDGMLAAALGLEMDRVALYGTGAGQPLGLRNTPGVNEVEMDTNGAAPADYDKWLDTMQAIEEDNGSATTIIQAPRTKFKQAKLVTGIASDKTKLTPPAAFAALTKLTSNQVSITEVQGSSGAVATTDFFGGFGNCAFGLRQNITIEMSRQSGTTFEKNQTHVRAIMRGDFVALRPNQLGRLVGIL